MTVGVLMIGRRFSRLTLLSLSLLLLLLFTLPFPARATQEYTKRTGKGCIFCHKESTGGQLRTVGFAYIRNGYHYPIPPRILEKAEALQTPVHKTIRFLVGYLHLLAAVIFFGAIFYIHIFVRPARLTGGIPRHERLLGLSCMATLALTGTYLTWVRIDRWEQFFNNTFGLMLFIKIVLFLTMVAVGVTAVTIVNRRMKQEAAAATAAPADTGEITREKVRAADGSEGRPAYIVYEGKVYDVSASPRWKEGRHFGKHAAGTDLTEALKGAPHGPEVLEQVILLGEVSAEAEPGRRPGAAQRIFVKMAYGNLVLVFLILACISV